MTVADELTREELLDVALLDVIGDEGSVPVDAVIRETRQWCSDERSWTADVLPLLGSAPTRQELEARQRYVVSLGMLRQSAGMVEVTRAGRQMWEGFPWEYAADDEEER